ncbi:MAG: CPBP family intramembrane metalloprotease, partial [Planctomycetes bacterium]|nr:CPBP family intramembrane metalloprotease [Planctomycetota bacterium]
QPNPWPEMQASLRLPFFGMLLSLLFWYYGPSLGETLLGKDVFVADALDGTLFRVAATVLVLVLSFVVFRTPSSAIGLSKPRLADGTTTASLALLSGGVFAIVGLALLGVLHYFPEWLGAAVKGDNAIERLRSIAAIQGHSTEALLTMVVALPLMEEIFFRGLLYSHLRREFGPRIAVGASALVFALAHANALPLSQLIGGLFFAWAFERTGRLWAPIALHMLGNGTLFLLSWYLASALDV